MDLQFVYLGRGLSLLSFISMACGIPSQLLPRLAAGFFHQTASAADFKLYQEKVGKAVWLILGTWGYWYLLRSYSVSKVRPQPRDLTWTGPQTSGSLPSGYGWLMHLVRLTTSSVMILTYLSYYSISGYAFHFADGPTSWDSKKQSRVALSLTRSEYIAQELLARIFKQSTGLS